MPDRGKYRIRGNEQLKPDQTLRFYYHITSQEWGDEKKLHPVGGNYGNRAWDEPENPRTCVAPSIAHCLSAVTYSRASVYKVYRTDTKVIAYWPYAVEDAIVTRERWIIDSQVFVRVADLSIEPFLYSEEIPDEFRHNNECGGKEDIPLQKRMIKAWEKALRENKCGGLVYV
jgi:hypothetical protein